MLRADHHEPDTGWRTVEDLSTISELCKRPGSVVWAVADVSTLGPSDVAQIGEEFGLHPLAVEDAMKPRQRPKLEEYEGRHLFAIVHQLVTHDGQVEAKQIACFIGARFVLTLHSGADSVIAEAQRRSRALPLRTRGAEAVMHTLLDTIVDEYQDIADALEREIEDLEEIVLESPSTRVEHRLYAVKQQLARFRRYAQPVGRILGDVVDADGNAGLITPETSAYFRDVHDHVLRITDQVRNIEDLSNAAVEFHRSFQAQSLNEVTKKLTGWAAIIAVPTLIASVYGMNFRLFPPDGEPFGFWMALGLMAATGLALYVYFKKRRWI